MTEEWLVNTDPGCLSQYNELLRTRPMFMILSDLKIYLPTIKEQA